jgi:hypothetical protein
MVVIGLFLNVAVVALLCWALVSLAIHALPVFVGFLVFFAIQTAGQGAFLAAVGAVMTGGAVWGVGRTAMFSARSSGLRLLVAAMFALPAALAGYHLLHGLAAIRPASDTWRTVIGLIGALAIGATALARLVTDPAKTLHVDGPMR